MQLIREYGREAGCSPFMNGTSEQKHNKGHQLMHQPDEWKRESLTDKAVCFPEDLLFSSIGRDSYRIRCLSDSSYLTITCYSLPDHFRVQSQ
jgi:hypothetical protein